MNSRRNESSKYEALSNCNDDKEDDVDLDGLLLQMHCGENFNTRVELNKSIDDISCKGSKLKNNYSNSSEAPLKSRFLKKSLPISIFGRSNNKSRKQHLSSSPLACSAPQPHTPTFNNNNHDNQYHRVCGDARSALMSYHIYVNDVSTCHEVKLRLGGTCGQLIEKLLIQLDRKPELLTWTLVEQNTDDWTERIIEDKEVMDDLVLSSKTPEGSTRYCLNKHLDKYSVLRNPELCLPSGMLTLPNNISRIHDDKRNQMQHILTKTAPEICGFLEVREPDRKAWKRRYCILRNSGLYYSSKNTSKEPQHLVSIAEVHTAQVWCSFTSKRCLLPSDAPTEFTFCLKPRDNGASDRWFSADCEHTRTAWISCLRLKMDGCRFYNSFISAQETAATNLYRSSSDRSIYRLGQTAENFAAMDFSGSSGRVIHDKIELAAYKEEISEDRKRRFQLSRIATAVSVPRNIGKKGFSTNDAAWISKSMHHSQPWYFEKLGREEANQQLAMMGNIDGTFLMRPSETIVGGVVLTLVFNRKPRHFVVALMENHGEYFYTVDQCKTRFETLIHFIDFHRLNKGSLPCLLVHEFTRQDLQKHN